MHCTEPIYCMAVGCQLRCERQPHKAAGGGEKKRESETCTRPLIKLHQSSRKSQEFLQWNVYLPLCLALLLCPKVWWPKEQLQIQSLTVSLNQRSFSELKLGEAVGRAWQNNGALISSLFCRKEKNPDAFALCSFYFFHWPPTLQGFHCSPSLMACHHSESSS